MACEGMATQYPNFYFSAFGETYPPPADQIGFLMENFLYMEAMANENHATNKFWLTVLASLNQLKGLAEGYLETPCNAAATAAGVGSAPASQPDWAPASASPTAPGMSLLKIPVRAGLGRPLHDSDQAPPPRDPEQAILAPRRGLQPAHVLPGHRAPRRPALQRALQGELAHSAARVRLSPPFFFFQRAR